MKLTTLTKGRMMCRAALLTLCAIVFALGINAQERTLVLPDSTGINADAATMLPNHRKRTRVPLTVEKNAAPDSTLRTIVDLEGDTVHIADMDSVQIQAVEEELRQRELQEKRDSAELAAYGNKQFEMWFDGA
ncbi:MAG: hypothetical protein ACI30Q_04320, partial [Muribaculaceae bacterium]